MSRRGSAEGGSGGGESEVVVLKRRRLVAAAPLYAGLTRFNFLLDATQPGATPDALFMAALLDLVRDCQPFFLKAGFRSGKDRASSTTLQGRKATLHCIETID